jgi:hypothetical protein
MRAVRRALHTINHPYPIPSARTLWNFCHACRATAARSVCSGCNTAVYCGAACQEALRARDHGLRCAALLRMRNTLASYSSLASVSSGHRAYCAMKRNREGDSGEPRAQRARQPRAGDATDQAWAAAAAAAAPPPPMPEPNMRNLPAEMIEAIARQLTSADDADALIRSMARTPANRALPVADYVRASAGAPTILFERYVQLRLAPTYVAPAGADAGAGRDAAVRARRRELLAAGGNRVAWADVGARYWPTANATERLVRWYLPREGVILYQGWFHDGAASIRAALGTDATAGERGDVRIAQYAVRARLAGFPRHPPPWEDEGWSDTPLGHKRMRQLHGDTLNARATNLGIGLRVGDTDPRDGPRDRATTANVTAIRGRLTMTKLLDGALPNLLAVSGSVEIPADSNADLTAIGPTACTRLEWVGDSIKIYMLRILASIAGAFPALRTVAGAVDVYGNAALVDARSAFPSLVRVGAMEIVSNANLSTARGFAPNLTTVQGGLSILLMGRLADLRGAFASLETVGEGLLIGSNDRLETLADALPALRRVGSLTLQNNALLRDTADMFPALEEVGTGLTVTANGQLTDMDGALPRLRAVGANMIVHGNDRLSRVGGLRALVRVGGWILVTRDPNNRQLPLAEFPALLDRTGVRYDGRQ